MSRPINEDGEGGRTARLRNALCGEEVYLHDLFNMHGHRGPGSVMPYDDVAFHPAVLVEFDARPIFHVKNDINPAELDVLLELFAKVVRFQLHGSSFVFGGGTQPARYVPFMYDLFPDKLKHFFPGAGPDRSLIRLLPKAPSLG